ncbi:3-hydroxyacyl-CoA dehydrogenase [Alteribacter aurantiacus]|uniref:3-hydroxyacyl-CoA dehydrogenase n=1 Tax=Alteribacter aurantiacus TaxID=254410 RepID=UPI00041DD5FC|nr:3-hydroxyacyl-CoA dehydrogenase [Alteribacter aurantiacus]
MNMKDTIAFVTGGASGLGEAVVRYTVERGGKAIIFDRSIENGEKLVDELGDQTLFFQGDVTKEEDINSALDKGIERIGEINTVVNCAGIGSAEKVIGRKGIHSLERFSKTIEVNLIGTFNVIRLAFDKMKANTLMGSEERGVIINTASVAAFDGQIGQAAYSASKGGVVGMTLPIARELASFGIRVMTIAPGLFNTPMFASLPEEARDALGKMTPFPSRLGQPEEYAKLAGAIIENPMLNGEVIRLDGAIRMQPK